MAYFNVGGGGKQEEGVVIYNYGKMNVGATAKYDGEVYTVPHDGTIYLMARAGNESISDSSKKYYLLNGVRTDLPGSSYTISVKTGDTFKVYLYGKNSSSSAIGYAIVYAVLV